MAIRTDTYFAWKLETVGRLGRRGGGKEKDLKEEN
jgi:hypothetical protein